MQVFRDKRGGSAVMVVETDQVVPQEAIDNLESKPGIIRVKFLNPIGEEVEDRRSVCHINQWKKHV